MDSEHIYTTRLSLNKVDENWLDIWNYLLAGRQHQLVAGQRLVVGLRLLSGQRMVTGLRLVSGQRLVRYVESGFMGHLNGIQTFGLMCQIGCELEFPNDCVCIGC